MKRLFAVATVSLFVLVAVAGFVASQPSGTPPDLHCAITDTMPAGFNVPHGNLVRMDVGGDGSLYVYYGWIDTSPSTSRLVVTKYDTGCTQIWTRNPAANCPMSDQNCEPAGFVTWLRNGTVVVPFRWDGADPFTGVAWYSASDGEFLGNTDLANIGLTNSCCSGILPIYTDDDDTSVDSWIIGDPTTDQLVSATPDFTATDWVVGNPNPSMFNQLRGANSGFVCVMSDNVNGGSVRALTKINLTTGATDASFTVARFGSSQTAIEDCGAPSLTDDTVLYAHQFISATAEPEVLEINVTDWSVTQTITFDDAQIDTGSGPVSTSTYDRLFDVDRNDHFMVCGIIAASPTTSHITKYNSTEPGAAMQWNVTFNQNSADTRSVDNCQLDFISGLWWTGRWHDGTGLNNFAFRRYTGGDFNQPVAPAFLDEPAEVVVTPTPTVDAGGGIVNFATSIGFQSTGSQFLFGLVLVIIAMVVVAASIKSFSEGQPVMLAAGVAAVGMSIFNASIGLWAAWTTVVLVIIAAGIVAFIIRRGVFGFGQSGG